MTDKLQTLKALLAEANNLDRAIRLVSWDQHTQMPKGGSEGRANVLATLTKLQHVHFTSDEMGRLLEDLSSEAADLDPDSDDATDVHGSGGFTGVTQRYTYPRLFNLYLDPKETHSYMTRKLAYLEVLREGMRARDAAALMLGSD